MRCDGEATARRLYDGPSVELFPIAGPCFPRGLARSLAEPPLCFNERLGPFDDFDGEDHPLREACDIGAGEVPVPEPRGLIAARVDSQGDKQCR